MGECHFVICIRPRAVHFIGCHLFVSRILVTSSMCTLHLQRSQYTHRIRVSWFVTGGARGHLNRGPNEIRFQFSQSSIKFAAKAVVGEHLQSPKSAKKSPGNGIEFSISANWCNFIKLTVIDGRCRLSASKFLNCKFAICKKKIKITNNK